MYEYNIICCKIIVMYEYALCIVLLIEFNLMNKINVLI